MKSCPIQPLIQGLEPPTPHHPHQPVKGGWRPCLNSSGDENLLLLQATSSPFTTLTVLIFIIYPLLSTNDEPSSLPRALQISHLILTTALEVLSFPFCNSENSERVWPRSINKNLCNLFLSYPFQLLSFPSLLHSCHVDQNPSQEGLNKMKRI